MSLSGMSIGDRVRYVAITIPASGGVADSLENLVTAALDAIAPNLGTREKPNLIGGIVTAVATAYTVGNSAASLPFTVTNTEYSEPVVAFLKNTFVKSSGASIPVVVRAWYGGDRVYELPVNG